MKKPIDKTSQKFGRLQPIKIAENPKSGRFSWVCRCDCGNEVVVASTDLGRNANSCGCLRKEKASQRRTTHGLSKTRTYRCWWAMRLRCDYPSSRHYYRYGMRGIKVCDEWKSSFESFLRDMGECPSNKHSLDRIDNSGNYCKENCKWSTLPEQAQNTRTNHNITWNGETKCIAQWERDLGFPIHCLHQRIVKRGWSIKKAFTTPIKTCKKTPKSKS